jgi:hypothetical protein
MADVGLGQLLTTTGRYRSRELKEANKDSTPFYQVMDEHGGIMRIGGGRTIVDEALSGLNGTAAWVGANGTVALQDYPVADASEFDWKYMLCSVVVSLSEQYKNSGGANTKYIDLVGAKYDAAENSMMNLFHEGMLSAGTSYGGLQLNGLASLVSTTPTTGTVGTINRAATGAGWFQNQKFDTGADWSDGAVTAGNVKRFLDKGINGTMKNQKTQVQIGFLGQTHFEFLTAALQAIQIISNESGTAKAGFDKLVYRGIPMYLGSGVNYSGKSGIRNATTTYLLNLKKGGVNLVFHEKAEFDLLSPVDASDQAGFSRLLFTMAAMKIGGFAKLNWVGFDA